MLVGAAMIGNGLMAMANEGEVYLAAMLALVIGATVVAVGTGVLARMRWARLVGLLLAAVVGVVTLVGSAGRGDPVIIAISLSVVAANVFVVWALITSGRWFAGAASR
jgi:hypothetical protein